MKVVKDDLVKQKEMLAEYVFQKIPYNGGFYELKDFCEFTVNGKLHIECVMFHEDERIEIPITEIFKICYPYVDLH